MRSVVVVFPASMWAMMPMFRTRSSSSILGTRVPACVCVTATSSSRPSGPPGLPAVVGEGLVGLRHPVHVVLAFVRATLLIGGVQNLSCQLVGHLPLAPLAREGDQPA